MTEDSDKKVSFTKMHPLLDLDNPIRKPAPVGRQSVPTAENGSRLGFSWSLHMCRFSSRKLSVLVYSAPPQLPSVYMQVGSKFRWWGFG